MKRPLPPSQVIVPKDDKPGPMKGKFTSNQAAPHGCADEMNAQRQRPVYDEFRKRRDYKP
jgi:hypothetical protein